jgi:hypothetical protein
VNRKSRERIACRTVSFHFSVSLGDTRYTLRFAICPLQSEFMLNPFFHHSTIPSFHYFGASPDAS